MKLMQILKSKKGFTLMELIVVLIIIAILMAALTPSLIGWINEARESSLRVEGRNALTAVQAIVTEARGLGQWFNGDPVTDASITPARIAAQPKFQALMIDAGIYGSGLNQTPQFNPNTFVTTAGTHGIRGLYVEGENVVGIRIGNTVRPNRDVDGVGGNGFLNVGRQVTGTGYRP